MITPFLKGLKLTFRTLFSRPVTIRYPEEKMPMFPRFRGLHELLKDENGKLKCTACELCAAACPVGCIRVLPGETADHKRFPEVYEIDLARCIFCGFCAEACPYGCISLREKYETAAYTRGELIYSKDRLVHAYDEEVPAR